MDKLPDAIEKAIVAGGCFWGMEELFRELPGVVKTQVGYTGGELNNPTYTDVKTGQSGHAESLEILFDPNQLSYQNLLLFFFRIHDPTTWNRQGNDLGSQYRSAIFYLNDEQKKTAEEVKDQVERSGKWGNRKVVTLIEPLTAFHEAEEHHQKYLVKNPGGYTCHFVRDFDYR